MTASSLPGVSQTVPGTAGFKVATPCPTRKEKSAHGAQKGRFRNWHNCLLSFGRGIERRGFPGIFPDCGQQFS
jgi:hypothetical protein